METPLVTIVVPVYNGEQFLKESLDSIFAQTYRHLEVIVLDNCSTDRTAEIIKSYSDPRLRVVRHKTNIGGYPNFDAGLRLAKGTFIGIYHADDIYAEDMVAQELAVLIKHKEVGMVFTGAVLIDGTGERIGEWRCPEEVSGRPVGVSKVLSYMYRSFRSPFLAPSCFGRRSVFRKAGWFATKFKEAGDVDVYLRLTDAGGYVFFLDVPLVKYRHTGGQWSIRYSTSYTVPNELFGILDGWRGFLSPGEEYGLHRDWDYTVCAINVLEHGGEVMLAQEYLWMSCSLRRLKKIHKQSSLFGLSVVMLLASHVGLGRVLARRINGYRRKRHVSIA